MINFIEKRCDHYLRIVFTINFVAAFLLISAFSSCKRAQKAPAPLDIVLVGGGIMSATLASIVHELDHDMHIAVYEKLDRVALESSAPWNNAGTGHAAFAELNYTPENKDGSINLSKAIEVSEAFEVSKSYWAYLASIDVLKPRDFIHHVPHVSFVWGQSNVQFLRKRHLAMIKHPLFFGMEYSEDRELIKQWAPLLVDGRSMDTPIASTRMRGGVDVDFGSLTSAMFDGIKKDSRLELHVNHNVLDISRNDDKTWTILVRDETSKVEKSVRARFVFIGAGGGALRLLQKSGIDEVEGFGGFPVGGAWLVSERQELIEQHDAKVYGMAPVGSPPMSVPHLDTRFIHGKKALLYGPFATFSTKFLKHGSWNDLIASISLSNLLPMMQVGMKNLDLVGYLVSQVMLGKEEQLASLKEYFPNARAEDWRYQTAGQRVQVIKKDKVAGGILQFGTEVVSSNDKTLVALLGASPGASTAVPTMLNILKASFAEQMRSASWQEKLQKMIPSYGQRLADDEELIKAVRERNRQLLALEY